MLEYLQNNQIEEVSLEIAEIENIRSDEQDAILSEFYNLAMAQRYMEQGGLSYAQALLDLNMPTPAASALQQLLPNRPEDARLYKLLSQAAGDAGQINQAHEHMAEHH